MPRERIPIKPGNGRRTQENRLGYEGRMQVATTIAANVKAIAPQLPFDRFLSECVTFHIHGGGEKKGIEAMAYGIADTIHAVAAIGSWPENSPQVTCMAGLYLLAVAKKQKDASNQQLEMIDAKMLGFVDEHTKQEAVERHQARLAFLQTFQTDLETAIDTYSKLHLPNAEKYLVVLKRLLQPQILDQQIRKKLTKLLNNGEIDAAYEMATSPHK